MLAEATVNKLSLIQVNRTGGNRSSPVPVPAGLEPLGFKILNLNSKNEKNLKTFSKYFKVCRM
jgi:hypothetical protein